MAKAKATKKPELAPPAKAKAPAVKGPAMKAAPAKKRAAEKPVEKSAAKEVKKGRKKSEIDDIFGLASTDAEASAAAAPLTGELQDIAERIKKARESKKAAPAEAAPTKAGKKSKLEGSKDDIFGGDVSKSNRKKTEEGYAIYTEDELRLGKTGGDSELCPFDCECCF